MFLECCREVAADYGDVAFDDCMVDAAAYALVKTPGRFDVLVTSNQYGDILSDISAPDWWAASVWRRVPISAKPVQCLRPLTARRPTSQAKGSRIPSP